MESEYVYILCILLFVRMNHLINNRFLVPLLVIVVGLFVMIVPVDDIFSIKDEENNADKKTIMILLLIVTKTKVIVH